MTESLPAHDARGQQRQLVDDTADDQRMAGIVAALEAHDHVGALAEPIDDLALALVAPLRADYRDISHDVPLEISLPVAHGAAVLQIMRAAQTLGFGLRIGSLTDPAP